MSSDVFCCFVKNQETAKSFYLRAKWVYCIGFYVTAIATWMLRDYAEQVLLANTEIFTYCNDPELAALCAGKTAALRFCFANFVFFMTHSLVLFSVTRSDDPRVGFHTSLWFWKFILWAGTIVGFFFVPNSSVTIFAHVSRIGAGIFLVFQAISLLDLVYRVNEFLLKKQATWAYYAMVAGSLLTFGIALTCVGFAYHLYALYADCHLNIFFITWTLIVMLATVAVMFVPERAPTAGLLTSGVLIAYTSYLLMSALSSEPADYECLRDSGMSESRWIQVRSLALTPRGMLVNPLGVMTALL